MEIRLERRISGIHGHGIFTMDKIPQGMTYYSVPLDTVFTEQRLHCARICDGKYVYDNQVLNWVNHSCNPNSRLAIEREKPVLIALRDILSDSEVTVDYHATEKDGKSVPCLCRSDNCRGVLDFAS